MTPLILIIAMLAAPVVIFFLFRVNAAIVFLSLCLGSVLVRFIGGDAQSFVGLFSASKSMSNSAISLALLFLPAVLTTIFMIRTVRGTTRALINILPSLAFGAVGLLLAEPLLPAGLYHTISSTTIWADLLRAQDLIVGVSALIGLLFLWLQRPKHGSDHEGRRHGRH
jgi:hypothetical protein